LNASSRPSRRSRSIRGDVVIPYALAPDHEHGRLPHLERHLPAGAADNDGACARWQQEE
jgi:hypothetical protein